VKQFFISSGNRVLAILIFACGCGKSSSSPQPAPTPHPCSTDNCRLTYYKWEIVSQTVTTDIGIYKYAINQLNTINWATFLFKPDSTYVTYGGEKSNYIFTESTDKMVLVDNLLPLEFTVAFPTPTSMTLTGGKIQMHPRTDSSVAANFAINSIAGGLYNDFGVDTSRIHFFQSVFTYNGY
jgi:hypothetical protein